VASVLEQTAATGRRSRPAQRRRADRLAMAERLLVVFVFLILSGPPRVRTRGLSDALASPLATLDPSGVLHIGAWAGTGVLVAYILHEQPYHLRGLLRALVDSPGTRWYLLFGLMGIASAAYSPSMLYTLFFAGKIVLAILAIALVCMSGPAPRFDRALNLLFAVNGIRAITLVVLYVVDPSLVGEGEGLFQGYRLYGGFLGDYGESALLAGLWLLTVAIFGKTRMVRTLATIGYCASWVLLLASQTRSAITAGVLCFAILVSMRRLSRGRAALAIVGVVGLGLVLWQQMQVVLNSATRSGEGIKDLTGRTDAFDYLLQVWASSPIYGHGYGAGTRAALVSFVKDYGLGIGSGHDVLSTVLVDLGIVGATVLLFAFLAAWWQVLTLWRRTRGLPRERLVVAQLACLAVWITIASVVSSSLAGGSVPFLVLIGTAFALDRSLSARRRIGVPAMQRQAPESNGSP
jgi:O-antigen ligase